MIRSAAMPGRACAASRAAELGRDLADDVVVLGPRVHVGATVRGCASGRRRRRVARDDAGERRIVRQRADVVDDGRAEVDRALGDVAL